jgi:hypothetical protein
LPASIGIFAYRWLAAPEQGNKLARQDADRERH